MKMHFSFFQQQVSLWALEFFLTFCLDVCVFFLLSTFDGSSKALSPNERLNRTEKETEKESFAFSSPQIRGR